MDPILLRFLERLTVVLIGGLSIYLGYRLFRLVPEQKESSGKVELPWNTSIMVMRVGPGVFFALFGALTVGISLFRPLLLTPGPEPSYLYLGASAGEEATARADARALLRRDMALLNTLPGLLSEELAAHERDSIERGLSRVKLALMGPVWGTPEEGFGEFARFEQWVLKGEPEPPPEGMQGALALYRFGRREDGG